MREFVSHSGTRLFSREQVKTYLGLTASFTTHDSLVDDIYASAVDHVEEFIWRCIEEKTYDFFSSTWNDKIVTGKLPIKSVTHVKYYDADNAIQTLADTEYKVTREAVLFTGTTPSLFDRQDAVIIRAVVGHGDYVVEPGIKQMILYAVAKMYDSRSDEMDKSTMTVLEKKLYPYRHYRHGA